MQYHGLSIAESLSRCRSSQKGLTPEQAANRLREQGENKLVTTKKKGIVRRFFAQFADFMILILLAAAAISFVTSYLQHDTDYIDSIIILAIVVLNAITGMIQESRAEKAIEALKKMASPQATVLRDGKEQKIPATQLVVGDIVLLSMGDLVPADLRLLEGHHLRIEESSLTGESLPVEKEPDRVFPEETSLGDRKNMAFLGSSVSEGRGVGLVVATGMDTQMGHIAHMIHTEESPETPLQRRLAKTGKVLGLCALGICFLIFILGLFQSIPPLDMLLVSISLAVAAIPEGLPAVVTIVLAMGVRRMAQKRAIVRRLPGVETLGSASVICSDKTGTLTQNQMTVVETATLDGKVAMEGKEGQFLLELGTLCSNCTLQNGTVLGNPTEVAIGKAAGRTRASLERTAPRVYEVAFTSARKRMTTVHRLSEGGYQVICKGAPDVLLERCRYVLHGGREQVLSPSLRQSLLRQNSAMASRALRVLAVAYKRMDRLTRSEESLERDLIFCGFICMMDPPRKEVKQAVDLCHQAGIKTVMITGDHLATAEAIAKEIGILRPGDKTMTGAELDRMDQVTLEQHIYDYAVYARVSPVHKARIVKAFQSHGEVVAMTGDGVNDAPALKVADIGCAMGRSGTDVAKGAADLILTDDNFSTIVEAVQEGRGIYANIRKTIHFLLSCNVGEILTVLVSFLLGLPTPLLAIQLLWVNLVTDSLPALALGVDPIEKDQMNSPPVKQNSGFFAGHLGYHIVVEGCMIGSLAVLAYTIGRVFFDLDPSVPIIGRTMAFAVLSLSQLVHAFNMRSERSLFRVGIFRNKSLVLAFFVCALLQVSVIVIPPLSALFKTQMLTGMQWLIVAGLSLVPLLLVEIEKCFINRK
ncbi:MAG: calcium-translocating P-type ATPase, PMCA-type [Oscillospiraceae bacterium]|nr:calcium-translocating P-type ATPase, PMCA-type [Oscillospiraceae bacterium]